MNPAVSEALSGLDRLSTEAEFGQKFSETFADFGFDKFTYAGFNADILKDAKLPSVMSDIIYLTNLEKNWVSRYVEEDYASADPIMKACYASRLPIRWTESFASNSRSRREHQMMSDAWEHGIQRGLTVPIHGPNGEVGILSLNSDLSDREFFRTSDAFQHEVQLIAHYFHDAALTRLRREIEIPKPIALTDREVEILKWTVDGKTAWEIGSILNISERTVNFHIQNVMEKFGVHNKTQAAAKAVGMGLLNV